MGRFVAAQWPGDPSGATRAERTPCRYAAFVPDRLADLDLSLSGSQAADLVDVERMVLALNTTHSGLANLKPMARFLLRAEAVASSHIEGLVVNVRRLARSEARIREALPGTDETATAVLGNIRALDEALLVATDRDRPVTVEDLLNIHAALLRGTRDERWGGVVRTEENWIGGPNPCAAAFVPPPPEEVPALLADLADYLSGDDHPTLLQAAVAHVQFETIHPFADGNGRAGRALIQLVLRRRDLATHVVPPVSLVLATRANEYVEALDATRRDTDPHEALLAWTELFLAATGRACRDADHFAMELVALEERARVAAAPVRRGSATDLLIDALPALPVFTAKTAAEHLGRSRVAVNEAISRLERAGVIAKITLGRRNRAFEAVGLFEAFTGFERVLASPDVNTYNSPPVRDVPARPQ
jgi:Fic family protein